VPELRTHRFNGAEVQLLGSLLFRFTALKLSHTQKHRGLQSLFLIPV
jgi:hypothetical protein